MEGTAPIEWRRHPADLARLLGSGVLLLALLLLTAVEPDALTNVSDDLVSAVDRLPSSVRAVVAGGLQVVAVALPLIGVGWALLRRSWRPLAVTLAALVTAAVAMSLLTDWLDRVAPVTTVAAADADSWLTGRAFPSSAYLAAMAAVVTAVSPLLHRRWRQTLWGGVALVALLRVATAAAVPVSVAVAVLLGIVAGSAVLLALGAPARRLVPQALVAVLARAGLPVDGLEPLAGSDRPTFRAVGTDGGAVHVAFVGRDERDADLLYRGWRMLRVKGIEDQLSGVRPGAQVHHEALATLLAADAGVRVPRVRAVAETPDDDGLLALDFVEGRALADLEAEQITDDLLRTVWAEVDRLHTRRIAHRRLSTDQILVEADGRVTIIGLRWSRLAADDLLLAADVADLLVAAAAAVGAERSVAIAAEVVDDERMVAALPLIQPLALSRSTGRLVKGDKALVTEVRERVQAVTGADAVELFPLERISIGQVVSAFGMVFLVLVLLAFASNWSDISAALREADWTRLPATVVLAMLPFPAGALSLMGSVVRPLPLGRTTVIMFGQSFLNRFTPMNAGGMAMRVRYLQKGGTDVAVAAAAVGVTSAASGIMQGVLFALFIFWAGSSPGGTLELPDVESVALVVLLVAAVVGGALLVPSVRGLAAKWWAVGRAKFGEDFRGVAARPSKLALLFGGAGLSKFFTITCFVASCRAFDITLGFADLGLLYLIGSTVGSAVPTPGRGRWGRGRTDRGADRCRGGQRHGRGGRGRVPPGHLLAPGRARICLPPLLPDGRAGLNGGGAFSPAWRTVARRRWRRGSGRGRRPPARRRPRRTGPWPGRRRHRTRGRRRWPRGHPTGRGPGRGCGRRRRRSPRSRCRSGGRCRSSPCRPAAGARRSGGRRRRWSSPGRCRGWPASAAGPRRRADRHGGSGSGAGGPRGRSGRPP